VKAFGLRFIIIVNAKAGKFNFIPLLVTVGSGIGLLGNSCQVILTHIYYNVFNL
jgi:hypothetical protein